MSAACDSRDSKGAGTTALLLLSLCATVPVAHLDELVRAHRSVQTLGSATADRSGRDAGWPCPSASQGPGEGWTSHSRGVAEWRSGTALDPAPVAPDQYGPLTSREWTKDGVIAVTELHIGVAWGCGNARRATYGDRSCAGGRLMSGWTSPLSRQ